MIATGTYTADTKSTVFLLMRRPSLLPAALMLRPTMALDTPPMVVAMEHQDRKVRSLAAQHSTTQQGVLKEGIAHHECSLRRCVAMANVLCSTARVQVGCCKATGCFYAGVCLTNTSLAPCLHYGIKWV